MGDMAEMYDMEVWREREWCPVHQQWYLAYEDGWGCQDCEDGEPSAAQQEFGADE